MGKSICLMTWVWNSGAHKSNTGRKSVYKPTTLLGRREADPKASLQTCGSANSICSKLEKKKKKNPISNKVDSNNGYTRFL